jgi:hypothetical protein
VVAVKKNGEYITVIYDQPQALPGPECRDKQFMCYYVLGASKYNNFYFWLSRTRVEQETLYA